jgi:hypothetical protein
MSSRSEQQAATNLESRNGLLFTAANATIITTAATPMHCYSSTMLTAGDRH